MRRHWAVVVLAGALVVWCAAPLAVAQAGTWGTAIEIPGLGTLNARGNASVTALSCGAAGNCAAVGFYQDGSGHTQAFVASQA